MSIKNEHFRLLESRVASFEFGQSSPNMLRLLIYNGSFCDKKFDLADMHTMYI